MMGITVLRALALLCFLVGSAVSGYGLYRIADGRKGIAPWIQLFGGFAVGGPPWFWFLGLLA